VTDVFQLHRPGATQRKIIPDPPGRFRTQKNLAVSGEGAEARR
jgi:hypothetical protein